MIFQENLLDDKISNYLLSALISLSVDLALMSTIVLTIGIEYKETKEREKL